MATGCTTVVLPKPPTNPHTNMAFETKMGKMNAIRTYNMEVYRSSLADHLGGVGGTEHANKLETRIKIRDSRLFLSAVRKSCVLDDYIVQSRCTAELVIHLPVWFFYGSIKPRIYSTSIFINHFDTLFTYPNIGSFINHEELILEISNPLIPLS